MARIHKVEFYFVDYNDFYKTSDDLLYNIDRLCDGLVLHPECKISKSFEWYDDINLNHYGCSKDDCEKYFSNAINIAECKCESCIYYPPSSLSGKPCGMCDTNDSLLNCYCKKEEGVKSYGSNGKQS